MAKFNRGTTRPLVSGPMTSNPAPTTVTHEGAPAHERDDKSALFLLAVSNMVGEDTFYESSGDRDQRYRDLIHRVALSDPLWLYNMLVWLRADANMRSASLVGAAEFVRAWLVAQGSTGSTEDKAKAQVFPVHPDDSDRGLLRSVVDGVCQRADEPGEMLAYWTSRYGKAIPKPIKRGLSDACRRLYNEYSLLRYDTATRGGGGGFRFGDVIELVHARPNIPTGRQARLYRFAIERRQNRTIENEKLLGVLPTIHANHVLRTLVRERGEYERLLDPDQLRDAGFTWEDALSLAGDKVDKSRLWEALIPTMGYMALLRNLRNFDQAGLPRHAVRKVEDRIGDPAQVERSRQLPFRFYSAYNAVTSANWVRALEDALNRSVKNIPVLPGRTLVLVDTSGSMSCGKVSERSSVTYEQVAALFGVTLAVRNAGRVDLHGFATGVFKHPVRTGDSVLRQVQLMCGRNGEVGHGTEVANAIRSTYAGHDRVIIISDEQTHYDHGHVGRWRGGRAASVTEQVPSTVPMYAFNLGGYAPSMMPAGGETPNRHQLGGLNDSTFGLIQLLERGRNAGWPWEDNN